MDYYWDWKSFFIFIGVESIMILFLIATGFHF